MRGSIISSFSLLQLGFFVYYRLATDSQVITSDSPVPIDSIFIYRPDRRLEIWRFFTYMLLHASWIHLIFNLLVQIVIGIPLELMHGSLRIGTIYMAGILAGSLGTSVFDSDVYLVGASGGVYALLAAYFANVVLNFNQIELGILKLVGILIVAFVDIGVAIYGRYYGAGSQTQQQVPTPSIKSFYSTLQYHPLFPSLRPQYPYQMMDNGLLSGSQVIDNYYSPTPVSYLAHLAGACAGLSISLLVLKKSEYKLYEQLAWWVVLGIYSACILFAVLFNLFN